ncbi:MAG: beta-N-acetylhexosaminidase [Phycisphaerae bacterium]|nr:beta-N-acetylhexosaminidase [Phycisphaerae bacterium]
MKKTVILFLSIMIMCMMANSSSAEVSIIPKPTKMQVSEDETFSITKDTVIVVRGDAHKTANYFQQLLKPACGFELDIEQYDADKKPANFVGFGLVPDVDTAKGSYLIKSKSDAVIVVASDQAGLFYGAQTLRQLLPVQIESKTRVENLNLTIPVVQIQDTPRFQWRAFMLDESRYFKGEKEVKKLLDQMALHKMNVFHWHLTDDQGWRIEIKKYPKLTEIGSKRKESQIGGWNSNKYDGKPHSGFYSQKQIRDIVKYAADRHITIVPEIDMPGHASAAIASYSWLGTKGHEIEVPSKFGKHYDIYKVSDPKVMQFIEDVMIEVIDLFPSDVIHIGGDEVKYDQWKSSEEIKAYMTKNKLDTPADLQIYFTNQLSKFFESKNRRMMGWNEIMGGQKLHAYQTDEDTKVKEKLATNTIIHFWKGDVKLATKAASDGYDIVNSLHTHTYLDYGYNNIPLKKAYNFEPIPKGLDEKYHDKVKGLGCQMWGEWIPTVEKMEKQIYPRLSAYAEVGWTATDQKDFDDFSKRVEQMKKRWDIHGIGYTK